MIYIENEQNKLNWNEQDKVLLEEIIHFALKEEKVFCEFQLSVLLVDNEEIRNINREHRNIDKETDVLSFPQLDYPEGKVFKDVYTDYVFPASFMEGEELVLGDIVLSLEKAMEQSKEYGHSYKRELSYLTIHSILHLLGYDHIEEKDKLKMREREEDILIKLDIRR